MKVTVRRLPKKDRKLFLEEFSIKLKPINLDIVIASDYSKHIGGIIINKKSNNIFKTINEIIYFRLLPKYRGLGYGKLLLDYALRKINSASIITNNRLSATAFHVFEKFGFTVIGRLNGVKYWSWTRPVISSTIDFDFFCKPYNCKMLKIACLKRQKLARVPSSFQHHSAYANAGCANCKDAYVEKPLKNSYKKVEIVSLY